MRKILTIGGNDVAFECNAVTSFLYKQEFGKNYFGEMLKLGKISDVMTNLNKISNEELENIDFDVIPRLAWACAKTADEQNTNSFMDWIRENKEFNITEHGTAIIELVQRNFETKKN